MKKLWQDHKKRPAVSSEVRNMRSHQDTLQPWTWLRFQRKFSGAKQSWFHTRTRETCWWMMECVRDCGFLPRIGIPHLPRLGLVHGLLFPWTTLGGPGEPTVCGAAAWFGVLALGVHWAKKIYSWIGHPVRKHKHEFVAMQRRLRQIWNCVQQPIVEAYPLVRGKISYFLCLVSYFKK